MTLLILGVMFVAPSAAAQAPMAAALAGSVTPPSPHSLRIVITKEVFEELEILADTLRVETVRCLIGVARGDSVLIDLAWQPPIQRSTRTSVAYRQCPVATIALWHNHPWTRDVEPEYSCYLSRTDIREALQSGAPPIQMVQVTATVACWWTQAQVVQHADAPVLKPLPQQARGRFHLWSAVACSAEAGRVVCERPVS